MVAALIANTPARTAGSSFKAKRALQEIWLAETKAIVETYGAKYDKAVACLMKDREALLAFYDSLGSICAQPTQSKARSPPSDIGRSDQRAASRTRRHSL
jgi:hypothetical protein